MSRFDPYSNNGGTSIAISGPDFSLVASDTRQSEGYLINTRDSQKAYEITKKAVLTFAGFHADGEYLVKLLKEQVKLFEFNHNEKISTESLAQLIQIILYSRRFFPLYSFIILAGIDRNGKGCVYNYDPVGSVERLNYSAIGSGLSILQPFLDNQIGKKNQAIETSDLTDISLEQAVQLSRDAFASATERDIYTGDYLQIFAITSGGIEVKKFELKFD